MFSIKQPLFCFLHEDQIVGEALGFKLQLFGLQSSVLGPWYLLAESCTSLWASWVPNKESDQIFTTRSDKIVKIQATNDFLSFNYFTGNQSTVLEGDQSNEDFFIFYFLFLRGTTGGKLWLFTNFEDRKTHRGISTSLWLQVWLPHLQRVTNSKPSIVKILLVCLRYGHIH